MGNTVKTETNSPNINILKKQLVVHHYHLRKLKLQNINTSVIPQEYNNQRDTLEMIQVRQSCT